MFRLRTACLLSPIALLPTAVFAQDAPAADATAPKWVSHQSTDPAGTRTCAVYPLRTKPFPMIFFYGRESSGELSLEGSDATPMDLTLQVDANPVLDGGFPTMSRKNTAALINQMRANGQNLRLSQSLLIDGKLKQFHLDLPLMGAVDELDKCSAWLKP
ncbi:hypothetical protein DWG18_07755 [Lysobacter sp. TY2-98]|uniref:hypothetical protein n=1 Tax=Lysobacter sp. TY2-98 TaxID=2290922 RepID=UPI000E2089DA|nr:hypothetical protein [Lysobacter sp. TY2-98]AXK72187.1 hypothetical protein DWG18_07755 [Lysobacter sp. TY2-98]